MFELRVVLAAEELADSVAMSVKDVRVLAATKYSEILSMRAVFMSMTSFGCQIEISFDHVLA